MVLVQSLRRGISWTQNKAQLMFDGIPGVTEKPTLYACFTCRSMSHDDFSLEEFLDNFPSVDRTDAVNLLKLARDFEEGEREKGKGKGER